MDKLKQIPNNYRPFPFWSWNDKLEVEETKRQVELMKQVGLGGFFMHARGGLETEYLSEEWFENISAGIEQGEKCQMEVWAYDENGWPSGFGNGKVNHQGIAFQQKWLKMAPLEEPVENELYRDKFGIYYFEVNPYYVDVLNPKVTEAFIAEIYEPYFKKYGQHIKGFFTDEPQIAREGIPWSVVLEENYLERYRDSLLPHLYKLFLNVDDYQQTRINFYKMITDLFSANFVKKLYEWCTERGLGLTGHFLLEETLESQLLPNGAVMPHYEYLSIPGVDWLTRNIYDCLTMLQVGSVAQQLGKKQVIAENYALSGHTISFDEMRRILEWQMVQGVTLLCPHLQGYTLKGIRKRDYPPALFYQQPWWKEYHLFIEEMSRIGMLLSEGETVCTTLLIHPQTSAWAFFNGEENLGLAELHQSFLTMIKSLQHKHVLFHLGDETLMERHGKVEGNSLRIGTQLYKQVILPQHVALLPSTKSLLEDFVLSGGKIISESEVTENHVTDNPDITYTKRNYPDCVLHYFVNSTETEQLLKTTIGSERLNLKSGEWEPFSGSCVLAPCESLIIKDQGEILTEIIKRETKALPLEGEWMVTDVSENSLTLDTCDYYFDDILQEKNGYILNIQQRAADLGRPVNIRFIFEVNITKVSEHLALVCERPELYTIKINDQILEQQDIGYFRDTSFRKLAVRDHVHTGINKIEFFIPFSLSDEVYDNLKKAAVFESEKNKLWFDIEIEAIYLVGDFAVGSSATIEQLPRDTYRYKAPFDLREAPKKISLKNIEQQGYLFFAGELTVEKEFDLSDREYHLAFRKKGLNAVRIAVNGQSVDTVIWNFAKADISSYLKIGKNTIQLVLVSTLRNLLGPHHLERGESYEVAPRCFYKEHSIWTSASTEWFEDKWNDDYCFAEMSLF